MEQNWLRQTGLLIEYDKIVGNSL